MTQQPTGVFISYSREDSSLVDRLEADLSARGFRPWVDRSRLEAGDKWRRAIEDAIRECQSFILMLSPSAAASEPVREEVTFARRHNKHIVPMLVRPCPDADLPLGWDFQWIDIERDYDAGLANLLFALTRKVPPSRQSTATSSPSLLGRIGRALRRPRPEPPVELSETDLRDLYSEALAAEARGDLERAAIYLGRIVASRPRYLDGRAKEKLDALAPRLREGRIQRLRQEAYYAREKGDWAKELGAWRALLQLKKGDSEANQRVPIAETNLRYADQYFAVTDQVERGNLDAAREELAALWRRARYYGDPAGVAKKLGLTVPDSPEEEERKRRKAAQEAEERRLRELEERRKREEEERRRIEREKRTRPGFIRLVLEYSTGGTWMCLFSLLGGVGAIAGLLAQSYAVAIGVVVGVTTIAYVTGYWRAFNILSAMGIGIVSGAAAYGAVLGMWYLPNPGLRVFNYPFLGTLHVHPGQEWIFALCFAPLLGVPMGVMAVIVDVFLDDGDSIGVAWWLGLAVGLALGFGAGLLLAHLGWLVSGLLAGIIIGLIAGVLARDEPNSTLYLATFGVIAGISLVMWFFCAKVLSLDSFTIARWSSGLIVGAFAGIGLTRWVLVSQRARSLSRG